MKHAEEPSKLLILTNSLDGSSDVLVDLGRKSGIEIFRYNIDLFKDYELLCSKNEFKLSDPEGRTVDLREGSYKLLWRKPFLNLLSSGPDDEIYPIVRGNISAVIRTIVEDARSRKLLSLVEPYAGERITKLKQLHDATDFFQVPEYLFSIQNDSFPHRYAVTKALGESAALNQKILFTSKVIPAELERPFPWFLQTALFGGKDITAVYIDGKAWFYECLYNRTDENIDWRTEINTSNQSAWQPWPMGSSMELQIKLDKLMRIWGLRYGRLDFILDQNNVLWFLECNPNGQFGWLDDSNLTLHQAFLASALR